MPMDGDDRDHATCVATERRGGRPRSYASGMPRTAASTRAQGTLKLPPTIHRVNSQLNPPPSAHTRQGTQHTSGQRTWCELSEHCAPLHPPLHQHTTCPAGRTWVASPSAWRLRRLYICIYIYRLRAPVRPARGGGRAATRSSRSTRSTVQNRGGPAAYCAGRATLAANSNPWVDLAASAGDARAVTEGRADDRQTTASAAVQGGSEGRVTARRRMPLRHQLFLSVLFSQISRPFVARLRRLGGLVGDD